MMPVNANGDNVPPTEPSVAKPPIKTGDRLSSFARFTAMIMAIGSTGIAPGPTALKVKANRYTTIGSKNRRFPINLTTKLERAVNVPLASNRLKKNIVPNKVKNSCVGNPWYTCFNGIPAMRAKMIEKPIATTPTLIFLIIPNKMAQIKMVKDIDAIDVSS